MSSSIREQIRQLTNLKSTVATVSDEESEDAYNILGKSLETSKPTEDDEGSSHVEVARASLRMKTNSGLNFYGKAYEGVKVNRMDLDDDIFKEGNLGISPRSHLEGGNENNIDHDDENMENDDETLGSDDDIDSLGEEYADVNNANESVDLSTIDIVNSKMHKELDNDLEKGKAIGNQLGIWERLLEMRIKLQKPLQLSNRYPQCGKVKKFQDLSIKFSKQQKDVKTNAMLILDKLLELHKCLMETKKCNDMQSSSMLKGNDEESDEITSDEEDMIESANHGDDVKDRNDLIGASHPPPKRQIPAQFEKEVASLHSRVREHIDPAINKWDAKSRLAFGNQRKGFSSFDRSTLSQVKRIMLDKKRLMMRTKLKRSVYKTFGMEEKDVSPDTEEEQDNADSHLKNIDSEIYDDDDFYHQMLKEFIGRSTTALNDSAMSSKLLDLQELRNKSKKRTETKATKGRKIRYNVHSKLLNFMAPVSFGDVSEQSRNDLFKSLFGSKSI